MKYEWDINKQFQNKLIHNVDFTVIESFEWENAIIFEDIRNNYGERRFVAFAPIEGRLHCLVFTVRKENIRIISLRKANKREVRRYEKKKEETP